MIYLDNAATSFPKPREVLQRVLKYTECHCGNPGRSSHRLAIKAAEEVYAAREAVAALFSSEHPERVIFTQNATHALNIAIKTLVPADSHVLTSNLEHNSVIRPLERLAKESGVKYSHFSLEGDICKQLSELINPETRTVVCTLASNVTGKRADAAAISRFCREHGLELIYDASQLAGHEKIDLKLTPCSALCAPGHKGLFGLQGSGFIIFREEVCGKTLMEGGSGFDSTSRDMPMLLPERYEAGTLATPSIVSLASGIKYIRSAGLESISGHLEKLVKSSLERLSEIRGIKIYGAENGTLCFSVDEIHPSELAASLDGLGICVRAGLHCAPSAHRVLGTLDRGAVRASFSFLNSERDAISLADGIYKMIQSK